MRNVPQLMRRFRIGVIVGGTGSGKTALMEALVRDGVIKKIASPSEQTWQAGRSTVSAIAGEVGKRIRRQNGMADETACAHSARERLSKSGMNALPDQLKQFHQLSNGQ